MKDPRGKGGETTVSRYGREHMREIGRRGGQQNSQESRLARAWEAEDRQRGGRRLTTKGDGGRHGRTPRYRLGA